MKKLMIAAAIVCAAALSQAATITWSASKIYDGTGSTGSQLSGTAAYLFAGVQNIGEEGKPVTLTTAKIIEALSGVGASDANDWIGGLTKITTATDAGKVFDDTMKVDASKAGLAAGAAGEQTLFLLVFDTDSVTDASKFYVTSYASEVAGSGDTTFNFGNQKTATQNSANWYAVQSVPEPTSGLLLLLGVAGLALRRRRA